MVPNKLLNGYGCIKIPWQKGIVNFAIFIVCAISVLFLESTYVLALEKGNTAFGKGLIIRQEIFETNGVLVCRPAPLDEEIRHIIINNNIGSLKDYVGWLKENIKYKRDNKGDYWSTPEETLQKRYGDCEDYAFLNVAVLQLLGYQPKVLAMGGLGGIHAICVFEENGYFSWIDNTELKKTQTQSILEFAKYLFSEYGCCYLLTVSLKTKDWDILFKKSEIVNWQM